MLDKRKSRVVRFFERHHRMPSVSEIARTIGLSSKSRTHRIVERWVEEGFVRKDDLGRLVPGEVSWYLPFLGTVDARIDFSDGIVGKSVALDDLLLTQDRPNYVIKVNGNSMKDAAIIDGDHVVVEQTEECKPGDIVIARIDGHWTIKHLRQDGSGKRFLQAGDDVYSKIYPSHELKIIAVVTTVIRRIRPSP